MALCLELLQVVYHLAAKEGGAILQGWLVDDDLSALCLDALHDALDGALPEVIAVRLHRQAIDTDDAGVLPRLVVNIVIGIAIISCLLEHGISDIVLAGAVTLNNSLNQVLWNIGIVCQKLFGILRKEVADITE